MKTCWLIWNQEVLVTWEAGFRCEEDRVQRAENPGGMEGVEVKTGYSWKEFDWSRRKAHLECRVEEVLLVLGVYSSWVSVCVCVCVWGGGWYFSLSLLPFNKQWLDLRSWRTGVSQTPPLMGGLLQPPFERETSRDSPLAAIEILIVGALWRKSWKTNWMWRLEAVREPGPGGGWSF